MTGTEPHAPRGTAGSGPNWDRGPHAGHAGAARCCTKRHRRLWAQPGPWAVHKPRELHCMHISELPTARPFGDRWPRAGRRSCATRSGSYASTPHAHLGTAGRETLSGPLAASGPEELRDSEWELRVYACLSRHRRQRDPHGDRGLRAGRRSCVTRSGHTDVDVTQ
jgi:hypothetical protein